MFEMQPDINDPRSRINLDNVDKWAYIMISLAVVGGLLIFINRSIFGILGASLTKIMRFKVYQAILRKHVGWFDSKDNAPSHLTSTIATEV